MDKENVQAILFSVENWKPNLARKWLKKRDLKPIKRVHKTDNFYRYRIQDPELFGEFKTVKLDDDSEDNVGVEIIYGS